MLLSVVLAEERSGWTPSTKLLIAASASSCCIRDIIKHGWEC